jgi:hypothetical protein
VSGGDEQPVPNHSDLALTPSWLNPGAVARDGGVLLTVDARDSWFYESAILDLRTGKVQKIPLNFTGDVDAAGWLDDGKILASGLPFSATMWRFHRTGSGAR